MIKACKQVTIFKPLLYSSSSYISRGRPLSSTQFDMQVKGEAIEAHINDKEATYQSNISVLYINNRGSISEVYFSKVS
jgi:hypothetical protein